jgi:hypothetical protein
MNERIQALINQSWQNVEGAPREGMEDIRRALMEDLNPVFLEFARLMIQDSISILKESQEYYANPGKYEPIEYYEEMRAKEYAINDAISDIKSCLGVEE